MRDSQQPDLFDWRPPCEVIPFPHDRLLGRARRILDLKAKSSPGAMQRIWKKECDRLDDCMAAAGIDIAERDRQLDAFTDLVRGCIAISEPAFGHSGGDAA